MLDLGVSRHNLRPKVYGSSVKERYKLLPRPLGTGPASH
jgi:hypothetical protein